MPYIGCDVVDLDLFKPNGLRNRISFTLKVFTEKERSFATTPIISAMIWAAKESAYKLFFKEGVAKAFAPAAYQCLQFEEYSGENSLSSYFVKMNYKGKECFAVCSLSKKKDAVCAYAFIDPEEASRVDLFTFFIDRSMVKDEHRFARQCLAKLELQKKEKQEDSDYFDHPEFAYPVLTERASNRLHDLSMSHDGQHLLIAMLRK